VAEAALASIPAHAIEDRDDSQIEACPAPFVPDEVSERADLVAARSTLTGEHLAAYVGT
jgi:hypothetical protein